MFGCYRKGDANDPDTYVAAVAVVLSEFSPEVIQYATDPRAGIPRKSKYMLNPMEVGEFCEQAKKTIEAEKKLAAAGWFWNGERWEKGGHAV